MRTASTFFRRLLREPRHVVAFLRLLVFAGLAMLGLSEPPSQPFLFWVVTIIYGGTVLGYLSARNGEYGRRRVRCAIFLFDAAVVSALIVLRGRDVQDLVMAYFTLVFLAAILAGVGRPVLNAAVVSILYHFVSVRSLAPEDVLSFERLGQLAFFFVIAAFMGYVARDAQDEEEEEDALLAPEEYGNLRESTARLRRVRERLGADERLRTLDMVSMGVAHELRSPLLAMRASVQEGPALLDDLAQRLESGEPAQEVVDELRAVFQDSDHAVAKIHQFAVGLNELGCGSDEAVGAVSPREILTRARRLLRQSVGEDVQLEIRCSAVRHVRAVPTRVLQVILNLAANGIDAMRAREDGVLRLGAEDVGAECVAFTVADSGAGIAPEVRERMYDPFYTTKAPGRGTGLGLYVAREIVRAQAGSIECACPAGRGTTFRVEFPAAREAADAA